MRTTRTPVLLLSLALLIAGLLTVATRPAPALGLEAEMPGMPEMPGMEPGPSDGAARSSGLDELVGDQKLDPGVLDKGLDQGVLSQEDPYVVHELSSLAMLRDQFNHDFGRPRLILFLSPT